MTQLKHISVVKEIHAKAFLGAAPLMTKVTRGAAWQPESFYENHDLLTHLHVNVYNITFGMCACKIKKRTKNLCA
jgi:hypothetical protein